jgi:hypothetical protein
MGCGAAARASPLIKARPARPALSRRERQDGKSEFTGLEVNLTMKVVILTF